MSFRVNRLRLFMLTPQRADFAEAVAAVPEGVSKCLCCERPLSGRARTEVAMIFVADESDEDPFMVCSVVCRACSTLASPTELISTWVRGLVEQYGGTTIPDLREPGHA